MEDPGVVSGLERVRNLNADVHRVGDRHRPARDQVAERRPFDQFQHETLDAVDILAAIDGRDVGMTQRRQDLRFAFEAPATLAIGSDVIGENLEGDIPAELRVVSTKHFAHATTAERVNDLVDSGPASRCQRHGRQQLRWAGFCARPRSIRWLVAMLPVGPSGIAWQASCGQRAPEAFEAAVATTVWCAIIFATSAVSRRPVCRRVVARKPRRFDAAPGRTNNGRPLRLAAAPDD